MSSQDRVSGLEGAVDPGVNACDHRGRDGVLAFFAQAARLAGGTLCIEVHDVLVGDAYAAAVATYRATRPDRTPLEN